MAVPVAVPAGDGAARVGRGRDEARPGGCLAGTGTGSSGRVGPAGVGPGGAGFRLGWTQGRGWGVGLGVVVISAAGLLPRGRMSKWSARDRSGASAARTRPVICGRCRRRGSGITRWKWPVAGCTTGTGTARCVRCKPRGGVSPQLVRMHPMVRDTVHVIASSEPRPSEEAVIRRWLGLS